MQKKTLDFWVALISNLIHHPTLNFALELFWFMCRGFQGGGIKLLAIKYSVLWDWPSSNQHVPRESFIKLILRQCLPAIPLSQENPAKHTIKTISIMVGGPISRTSTLELLPECNLFTLSLKTPIPDHYASATRNNLSRQI